MSKLKIDKEKQSFLLRLFEVYLKLTPEEEIKLIAQIKKDEETFDISSLPISFVEWGKEIGREEGEELSLKQVAIKMLQDGMQIEKIMKYTILSRKRIEKLKRKI